MAAGTLMGPCFRYMAAMFESPISVFALMLATYPRSWCLPIFSSVLEFNDWTDLLKVRSPDSIYTPMTHTDSGDAMAHITPYQSKLDAYTEGKDPLEMQSSTATVLAELIEGVPVEKLRWRPLPHKSSVTEILAHLVEDELASSWRYRQMIENSGCPLAGFDQDEWARLGHYSSWSSADALQMFRLLREANLRMLRQLTTEEWARHGMHAERGRIV
jgi:DinB superfamily